MSKYLSDWESWGRSLQLAREGDYLWDIEAIQDTGMEQSMFLEQWSKMPEENTRLSVAHVCSVVQRKGNLGVLGKRDDGRFVLVVSLNEENAFGWFPKEDASAFDAYVRAMEVYQNAGPWVKWAIQKTSDALSWTFGIGEDWDKTKPYAHA